jgi:hypothetical protein
MSKTPETGGPGVGNVPELEQVARQVKDDWVKAGKAAPEPAPAPPAPAAPPPPPPAAAAPAPEPPPSAPTAPAPPATAAEVEEFIEAILAEAEGDKPAEVLKIPAKAKVPLKVNGEIVYRPAKDALASSMLEEDYSRKQATLGANRRELEQHAATLVADRARVEAREKFLNEEIGKFRDAQKDPVKWEAYQNHLQLLASDPEYAKVFEDALKGRERAAVDEVEQQTRDREALVQSVSEAAGWIIDIGNEPAYQHVDLDRVRAIYSQALESGQAGLDPEVVRHIFEQEARYLTSSTSPLAVENAALRAQVASLTDPAGQHNRATEHALKRAAAPPVVTGQPAAPAAAEKKVKPFSPRELPDVNAAWNARRD